MKNTAIFVIVYLLFSISLWAEGKSQWVSSVDGLNMRSRSVLDSEVIAAIPFGEKVELFATLKKEHRIGKEYGYWSRIRWNNKMGWVFGGYLRNYDVNSIVEYAAPLDGHLHELAQRCVCSTPDPDGGCSISTIPYVKCRDVERLGSSLVKIIDNIQDVYIIEKLGTIPPDGGEYTIVSAVLVYNNGWSYLGVRTHAGVHVDYINADKLVDIIAESGCCGHSTMELLMKKRGEYEVVQEINFDYGGWYAFIPREQCSKEPAVIGVDGAESEVYSYIEYIFDCNKNQFIPSRTIENLTEDDASKRYRASYQQYKK